MVEAKAKIAILDDDHVIRMARYALGGPGEITDQYVRDFFLPEDMDPARVYAAGRGLHEADGVSLVPMVAKLDVRQGSDASILIFRRGIIDAALIAANPKLKLIQRIGARADSIDLTAAAAKGILVSCIPRQTIQYTAEHAILLMLALSKASHRSRRCRAQRPLGSGGAFIPKMASRIITPACQTPRRAVQ